ncbi:ATP-dependent DNA ligase [Streptomyces sp. NPDC003832]
MPPEPMLTSPTLRTWLPPGWAGEPKWDGFRALLSLDGKVVQLSSRHGTDMTAAFPEITGGAASQLADATLLDGELVVPDPGQLASEPLHHRVRHRGADAVRAARQMPAHFVAFDVLRTTGTVTTGWSYQRRRAVLESLFTARRLRAPFTLCPSATDPDEVAQWLTRRQTGIEGVVYKRLTDPYRPGVRGWLEHKPYETTQAVVGAVTGTLTAPRTLLLGRPGSDGHLHCVGRTVTLSMAVGALLGPLLAPAGTQHQWTGEACATGRGSGEITELVLVEPELVVEVAVDTARDASGRWRHPARFHRVRAELRPMHVPGFGEPDY